MIINPYRFSAAGPPNTLSLLHFDGSDGTTTFVDQVPGVSWTANSGAEIDTSQSKFGSSSGLFPAAVNSGFGRIQSNTNPSFAFGTSDFTIEGFMFLNAAKAGFRMVVDMRDTGGTAAPTIYVTGTQLVYFASGSARITSAASVISLAGVWQHWALSRASGTSRLFVAGNQVGSSFADSINFLRNSVRYGNTGASNTSDNILGGWLDECRISDIARYTANFTPPASPF